MLNVTMHLWYLDPLSNGGTIELSDYVAGLSGHLLKNGGITNRLIVS